jgi:iron complex outermembrane recepter protein
MRVPGSKIRNVLLASAGLCALLIGSAANAQIQEEQPATQADPGVTGFGSPDIIVTAQKREERILDIPQSVSVVSGETLERQQATTFQDYLNQIPGMSLEQSEPGAGRIMLRGVNTGGVASTVAVYIDETPFGSSSGLVNGAVLAADFDPFDVARIEVLRGPQGTLYGASSLGGVLKFVTNTPRFNEFSARARGGLEFVDGGGTGYNMNGVVNVPLGAGAAFRGTGFHRKRAGWVDAGGPGITLTSIFGPTLAVPSVVAKDINDSYVWGGRGSVLVQATDRLTVRLTAHAQDIKSDGSAAVEVDPATYNPIDGLQRTQVFDEPNKLRYRLYNGVLDYDLGFATLLSSTSFARQNQTFTDDYTAAFGSFLNVFFGPLNPGLPPEVFPPALTADAIGMVINQQTNLKKFTQEVRLASPSNDRFEWMVGAYYTKERGVIDQHLAGMSLTTGQPFTDPVLRDLATAVVSSRYREVAGFANVTWHITDRLDITAGGRLSQNKQSAVQATAGNPLLVGAGGVLATSSKEDVFTYSVSPRYDISDTTAVYARLAKGYRPGGPNILPPNAGPNVPRTYDADTITSYEIGLKSNISRMLSFDVALYRLDWRNIQLFTVIDNFGLNANGGAAESTGLEGSLNYRPMTGLQLGVHASLIDAKLTADTPPFVGGFKGDRLPWVPRATFSLNGDYEWYATGTTLAFVGATLAYTGRQRGNFEAGDVVGVDGDGEFIFAFTPQRRVPAYTTLNLRAGANFGRFTLEAFARNVTNSRGITSLTEITDALTGGNPLTNGAIRASFTQPRTIGVTFGAEF